MDTWDNTFIADASTQGADLEVLNSPTAYGNIQTGTWNSDAANLMYALNGNVIVPPIGVRAPSALLLLAMGLFMMRRTAK